MKVVNFLLAVVFLLFAFVQLNDPDPVVWILIYGTMAVLCVLAMFSIHPRRVYLALLVALLGYSLFYIPGVLDWLRHPNKSALFDEVAKMEHLYIEESREFLGILICVGVLVLQMVRGGKR